MKQLLVARKQGNAISLFVSVAGRRDDADVEEVVRVTQVLAQPLNGRLQHGLDAVNHHLISLRLVWEPRRAREETKTERNHRYGGVGREMEKNKEKVGREGDSRQQSEVKVK